MDDERNLLIMNDPRRVSAQSEMDAIVRHGLTSVLSISVKSCKTICVDKHSLPKIE